MLLRHTLVIMTIDHHGGASHILDLKMMLPLEKDSLDIKLASVLSVVKRKKLTLECLRGRLGA